MVFALIGDIGLVEVRAGPATQRRQARPMLLVERRWNRPAGSFGRSFKLRLRAFMILDQATREGLHLGVAGPVEGET